jgi:glycosyltransferase involved in cell wall biosynthesis
MIGNGAINTPRLTNDRKTAKRMKILFVTSVSPYPPTVGGNQRTHLLLRALREIGDVDLILYTRDGLEDVLPVLERDFGLVEKIPWDLAGRTFPFSLIYPLAPRLVQNVAGTLRPRMFDYRPVAAVQKRIRERMASRQYDIVVGRYLLPTLKTGCLGTTPAILDIDDIDSQVYWARLRQPGLSFARRASNGWQAVQISQLLPSRLRLFSRIWVCQDDDETIRIVPNRVYLPNIPFFLPPAGPTNHAAARKTILFVGSFYHLPNEPAVDYFVEKIWPELRSRHPDVRFKIVGSNLQPSMRARWERQPGVEATGFVDDLSRCYEEAAFAVVPLQSVTGTNIKILEALAHQRTCVVSSAAHAGYANRLRHGESLLVVESSEDFVVACDRLLKEEGECAELARRGRDVVDREFSYEKFRTTVAETVESCLKLR